MKKAMIFLVVIIFGFIGLGVYARRRKLKGASNVQPLNGVDFKKPLFPISRENRARGCDPTGCGHFDAPRGNRKHKGFDIWIKPGEPIYAPIGGKVIKHNIAYSDTTKYRGITVEGDYEGDPMQVKMLYVTPLVGVGKTVKRGQKIGEAQDITERYNASMRPHVHVEVFISGQRVRPEDYAKV